MGANRLTCLNTGFWSGNLPRCEFEGCVYSGFFFVYIEENIFFRFKIVKRYSVVEIGRYILKYYVLQMTANKFARLCCKEVP